MTDLAATFLRSLREALSRVALQPDATVTSQVSADYVRVELRQGGLVLAAGTVHRSGVPSTTRQVELPFEAPATTRQVELPAPAAAPPAASDLVEIQITERAQQQLLWRPVGAAVAPLGPESDVRVGWSRADFHWYRTVVTREIADTIIAAHPAGIFAERPAGKLKSHVLTFNKEYLYARGLDGNGKALARVVDCQMIDLERVRDGGAPVECVILRHLGRNYAAPLAEIRYLDDEPNAVPFLVAGEEVVDDPSGAWIPVEEEPEDEPALKPRPTRKQAPPKTPKKAPKPSAAAKAVAEIESHEAAKHRAQPHAWDAIRMARAGKPFAAYEDDGSVRSEVRGKHVTEAMWVDHVRELAERHGTVRVYSRKGVCTWDSRDGAL